MNVEIIEIVVGPKYVNMKKLDRNMYKFDIMLMLDVSHFERSPQ